MDSAHSFSDYIPQGTYNSKFHKIYNNKIKKIYREKWSQFLQHDKEYVGVIMQCSNHKQQFEMF